uniref:Uncharacterized protein n=1 Tax=Anguilla anguilla TaxID=7936 RepID=A0A0E9W8Q4_ANGAN
MFVFTLGTQACLASRRTNFFLLTGFLHDGFSHEQTTFSLCFKTYYRL